jgi:hypothetical protein
MIADYRVRVVSDSENPNYLAKATWHDPSLRSGSYTIYSTPMVADILVVEGGVQIIDKEGRIQFMNAEALEAVLKVGGWKAQRPE